MAIINVTTLNDSINNGDGVISLREAIIQANSNPGTDDINLTIAGNYALTLSDTPEDASQTGDLVLPLLK